MKMDDMQEELKLILKYPYQSKLNQVAFATIVSFSLIVIWILKHLIDVGTSESDTMIIVIVLVCAPILLCLMVYYFYLHAVKIEIDKNNIVRYYSYGSRGRSVLHFKFELEDIALKYLHPDEYNSLRAEVTAKKAQRERFISDVITEIKESLEALNMHFDISGRSKHLYSVYKKMVLQHKQLDEIFDLTAVRIIVDNIKDCYAVLGQVHTMWKPIPGRFKDYIAMPKPNMYQSLHTTVLGDNGEPFEIQIRTYEMHRVAEFGIAAHWKYKEGRSDVKQNSEELKLAWLRQTLEWQKDLEDPREFMETLKMDLFASQVFVFTPRGEVIDLPAESTPLDFAFKIHTDVGCHCVGAKVNGKMVTIDHKLMTGDIVEIITSANSAGPSMDWLNIAKSSQAKNKIRNWLRKADRTSVVEKGKNNITNYIKKKGYDPTLVAKNAYLLRAVKDLGMSNINELYASISSGGAAQTRLGQRLIEYYTEETHREEKKKDEIINKKPNRKEHNSGTPGITVKGADNLLIKVARCCNPVPGDDIIGFITKGRGITVHRKDCTNILSLPNEEKARLIDVEWETPKLGQTYYADVNVSGQDRKGMFSDISKACEDLDIKLSGVNMRPIEDNFVTCTLTVSISDTHQMQRLLIALRNVPGISEVYRVRS